MHSMRDVFVHPYIPLVPQTQRPLLIIVDELVGYHLLHPSNAFWFLSLKVEAPISVKISNFL